MEITRLLHVSQSTRGALEPSRSFYVDTLGLRQIQRPELEIPGFWLALGEAQLHLNGRIPGRDSGVGPWPTHICLGVEDLGDAVRELASLRIRVSEGGSLAALQVWLRDPAGNTIEIQEDKR